MQANKISIIILTLFLSIDCSDDPTDGFFNSDHRAILSILELKN